MGVDLHMVREKKVDGLWVTAQSWHDEDGYKMPSDVLHLHNRILHGVLAGSIAPRGYPVDAAQETVGWVNVWGYRATPFDHSFLYTEELVKLSRFINEGVTEGMAINLPMGFNPTYDAFEQPSQLRLYGKAEVEIKGWVLTTSLQKFERGGSVDYSLIYPLSHYVSPSIRRKYTEVQGAVPLWFVVREELNKLLQWAKQAGDDSRVILLKTN